MTEVTSWESELKSKLRVIPDWPKKGVNFVDITTLIKDANAFKSVVDILTAYVAKLNVDVIVGVEARGFIFGAPIAYNLGLGFVPARKKGKLPAEKVSMEYALEYGSEYIEMHSDGISKGQKVAIVDDLLATGGTAEASARLVEKLGGVVSCLVFIVELDFLNGRKRLGSLDVESLVHFDK
jgi:adenine phosphoribosyltransferase